MKPHYLVIAAAISLSACSFSGFQPPRETSYWRLSKSVHPNRTFEEYVEIREKDMRACGMDPFISSTGSAKVALCMESKGWYYTAGPVCEQYAYNDQKACIEWRAKRGQ